MRKSRKRVSSCLESLGLEYTVIMNVILFTVNPKHSHHFILDGKRYDDVRKHWNNLLNQTTPPRLFFCQMFLMSL